MIKLRFQLALLVVVVIVASLAAVMLLTLQRTKNQAEEDAKNAAVEDAKAIAHDLSLLIPMSDDGIERKLADALTNHRRLAEIELELNPTAPPVEEKHLETPPGRFPHIRSRGPKAAAPAPPPPVPALIPAPPSTQPTKHVLSVSTGDTSKRGVEYSCEITGKRGAEGACDPTIASRFVKGKLSITLSLGVVDSILQIQSKVTYEVASVAVVLATLLMLFIGDRIIGRPLARLAASMAEVSTHGLDRRVKVAGPPEIRKVSEAFNKMLDQLQAADKEIRSFNERLAAEVATATAALSEQNTALGHLNALLVRAREDLSHKERLAALGQLAAQLAHEIGTPLGSVSGHLQLAMASPDCSSALRDRLSIASQEITRVSRIIRDYLDSTRRIDPTISTVDIDRTIREAVEVARGGNPARAAPVSVEVSSDSGKWRTDEGLTRQILVNLVANALDAVSTSREPEKGSVNVRASTEDTKTPGRRELVLRVSDTGPGLSAEAVGRLFEPFYTTKGRGKGTGLGLAICRELAQSLGGKIEAASEPGRGTTFTVRIANGDEIARRAKPAPAQMAERASG